MVTVKAVKTLIKPVTLGAIKADERLAQMALVRQGRLSVTAVTPDEWAIIMAMGETSL
jgi:predicted RNA-binding protein with PUA-like domain